MSTGSVYGPKFASVDTPEHVAHYKRVTVDNAPPSDDYYAYWVVGTFYPVKFTELSDAVEYALFKRVDGRRVCEVWHADGPCLLTPADVEAIEAHNKGAHLHAWTNLTAEDATRLAEERHDAAFARKAAGEWPFPEPAAT